MDTAITIRRGDRLYGPYSPDQIREMLGTGSVVLDDEAWSESDGQWTTLRHMLAVGPNPTGHGAPDTHDSLLGNLPALAHALDIVAMQSAVAKSLAGKRSNPNSYGNRRVAEEVVRALKDRSSKE